VRFRSLELLLRHFYSSSIIDFQFRFSHHCAGNNYKKIQQLSWPVP
jgi:hypothetical protein